MSDNFIVYALRQNITDPDAALKPDKSVESQVISKHGLVGKVYFKYGKSHEPEWLPFVKQVAGDLIPEIKQRSPYVAVLVKGENRWYALTYGYGRSLLRQDSIEQDFGLTAVLNAVDPDELRVVDTNSLDSNPILQRTQIAQASPIGAFAVNTERDKVLAVSGRPEHDDTFGTNIQGRDAVKFRQKLDWANLPQVLKKLDDLGESDEYKTRFPWMGNLPLIRDRQKIAELEAELDRQLANGLSDDVILALPEIVDVDYAPLYKYPSSRHIPTDQISWTDYLATLRDPRSLTVKRLKTSYVSCLKDANGESFKSFQVHKCLILELELGQSRFLLCHGAWYEIDAEYLANLNADLDMLQSSILNLPAYGHTSEDHYIGSICGTNPGDPYKFHKELVQYGGGQSKIELCDVLFNANYFVHIKRGNGSADLTHCFSQASVSMTLFLRDRHFRKALSDKFPGHATILNPPTRPVGGNYSVVYAVVESRYKKPTDFPLFARIALRQSSEQLQAFGVSVYVDCV